MNYIAKAEAAAWAFRFRGLAPTKAAVVMLCAHAHGPEHDIGDAQDLPGNWGGVQRRAMTAGEKTRAASGQAVEPSDPFETLHGDSDPARGRYSTWFHRSLEPDGSPNDVRAACLMLADIMDLRHVTIHDLDALSCAEYAERLYLAGYYRGFSPIGAVAIAAYASALERARGEWLDALANWQLDDSIPARPAFFRRAGETNEDVYARAVAHYVGCDDGEGATIHHRTAELAALYACTRGEKMAELKRPTNCGEFHLRLLGALGCPHPLATTPYAEALHAHPEGALGMLRQISSDLGMTIRGGDAWRSFSRGRLALYATGNNAHEESSQSTPDASGIAAHAGAGRSANGVSWGRSDIRFSAGRPLVEVYETEHLIHVDDEPPITQRSATLEGDSTAPLVCIEGDALAGEKVEGT